MKIVLILTCAVAAACGIVGGFFAAILVFT